VDPFLPVRRMAGTAPPPLFSRRAKHLDQRSLGTVCLIEGNDLGRIGS
jgi:hypothetical protein